MIFDRLMKLPPDATAWIVDHDPIIVAVDDQRLPTARLADATARAAEVLRRRGLRGGRRCVVWLESATDILSAYAAITALDAVPILISPSLGAATLASMVRPVADVDLVISQDGRLTELATLLPEIAALDWREVAAELPDTPRLIRGPELSSDSAYVVVHTSGTTSEPKLVECSSRSIEFNAKVQAVIHWATRLRGHCTFAISPVHGRTVVGILAALMRQAPLMLLDDVSPESVHRMLERHRPTYLETHPNTFRAWQHLAGTGAFSSVRFFGAGFDVIHPDTVKALLGGSRYRSAMCVEVYGQNESGPIAIRSHFRVGRRRPRRRATVVGGHPVGPHFPFCRVRIVDETGRRVPRGTPGRIVVRTPGVFTAYINRPEQSSRNYPLGRWWDTGDQGMLSRFGRLTLIDRQIDKVSSAASGIAIEDVLLEEFPECLEIVVLDLDGALQPVLSLRPGQHLRRQAWQACADDLAPMEQPLVIPDADFPRTVTGKIQRERLKARLRDAA